jgi:3-deoxy-D-manno-octulosonic-acid transferase
VLDCAAFIGAQDSRARDRFITAGASPAIVQVGGNLKFDAEVVAPTLNRSLAAMLRHAPLVVAGSTHDPEERILLDALRVLRQNRNARMVLAPAYRWVDPTLTGIVAGAAAFFLVLAFRRESDPV